MVERVPGEGDLPAVRGDLDDAPATLAAEVGQGGADEVDRPEEVGGGDVLDLRVGGLLGRPDDDAVTALEELLGEMASEAAADLRCAIVFSDPD